MLHAKEKLAHYHTFSAKVFLMVMLKNWVKAAVEDWSRRRFSSCFSWISRKKERFPETGGSDNASSA